MNIDTSNPLEVFIIWSIFYFGVMLLAIIGIDVYTFVKKKIANKRSKGLYVKSGYR